jgi:cell division protein FtsQ
VNTKKTIRKILIAIFSLTICGALLVLLVAAIGKKNREHCSNYVIRIRDVQNNYFIDEKDVTKLLTSATGGPVRGQALSAINLRKLEQLLEENTWVKDAELYFDNLDVLHVMIYEREPVARIFTTSGKSFYIDTSLRQLPLSEKMSARVPVFTGFPDRKIFGEKDSMLLRTVRDAAWFIMNNSFWMSQVEQVDISPERNFEMVPTVGDHIVKLGDGTGIEKKLHRLYVFYQQVLSKSGFDKYSVIDVQYAGQVIGSRQPAQKIDSVQLKLNVEKIIRESQVQDTMTTHPVMR